MVATHQVESKREAGGGVGWAGSRGNTEDWALLFRYGACGQASPCFPEPVSPLERSGPNCPPHRTAVRCAKAQVRARHTAGAQPGVGGEVEELGELGDCGEEEGGSPSLMCPVKCSPGSQDKYV